MISPGLELSARPPTKFVQVRVHAEQLHNVTTKGQRLRYSLCDLAGARTQDPNIKSVVLYQLSYEIIVANIEMKTARFTGLLFDLAVQMYGFYLDLQTAKLIF